MQTWFYIIYFLLSLGAAWLFVAMPRAARPTAGKMIALLGSLVLIGTVIGLLAGTERADGGERVWFFLFATVAIGAAAMMICQRKPVYSVLYFILTVLAVAALLLLQQAEFLAVALVIVYAGAILVVYVFVLMLARQQDLQEHDTKSRNPFWAVLLGFVLLGGILQLLLGNGATEPGAETGGQTAAVLAGTGSAVAVGFELFDKHSVALQIAGIILLIAAAGGLAIIKAPRIQKDDRQNDPLDMGGG